MPGAVSTVDDNARVTIVHLPRYVYGSNVLPVSPAPRAADVVPVSVGSDDAHLNQVVWVDDEAKALDARAAGEEVHGGSDIAEDVCLGFDEVVATVVRGKEVSGEELLEVLPQREDISQRQTTSLCGRSLPPSLGHLRTRPAAAYSERRRAGSGRPDSRFSGSAFRRKVSVPYRPRTRSIWALTHLYDATKLLIRPSWNSRSRRRPSNVLAWRTHRIFGTTLHNVLRTRPALR